jgi:deoxyribodipyrimidine photo-lyase
MVEMPVARTADPVRLPPVPSADTDAVVWVDEHLGHLTAEGRGGVFASGRFGGGQATADAALAAFDVAGYARARNEVWPEGRRGASALSPYIRHGLLTLPRVWAHVEGGPAPDVRKFRDELLWQEYARHLYARLGSRLGRSLRAEPATSSSTVWPEPWPRDMACMDLVIGELERDGWMVNQTRMWLASQWTVRAGRPWPEGEDRFFTHLLDGSRAANRVGWQWVVGAAGKAYGFSRWQVEKRAPGLCETCVHAQACPIQEWPDVTPAVALEPPAALRGDDDVAATGGPLATVAGTRTPEAVWLTAESLGDEDPALAAHPELPALFVFDAARLADWRLSGKRLVFLAQALAGVAATGREVEVWLGAPQDVLAGRALATTFTPVPGWRRLAAGLDAPTVHPWPWLAWPHGGRAQSFSAWVKQARGLVQA